jgi:single-stranded-DNA-specific exonuclease
MQSKWIIASNNKEVTGDLSKRLGVHPITAQILANRGITTSDEAQIFLNPKLSYLPDPSLLPDMEKAVARVFQAIAGNEKIAIFGDYDTDGVTSTALLVRFFRECGVTADSYIPNRLSEGYGLSKAGIDKLGERGTKLIITADNGTNANETINYANSLGIDVIVTDHHEVTGALPQAIAIINPKRLNETSEFRNLAGVGVAFYFACGLRSKLRDENVLKNGIPDLKTYLDLVAMGTVADVVPLTELNRILVKQGVEVLKKTSNIGIAALAEAASTPIEEIETSSIAFRLSPRINAAGRMGNHTLALDLLTTEDKNEATEIARKLNKMNSERQSVEKQILEQLNQRLEKMDSTRSSIVLWSDQWHVGVIGIAASRMAEAHRKPCALISIDGNSGRGSVRSVGNFNILDTLTTCAPTLKNFGGHTAAGGFDIDTSNLEHFSEAFEKHTAQNLTDEDRAPTIRLDAELELSDINMQLVKELGSLAPFGEGNPKPLFSTPGYTAKNARIVGTNHLKLKISDNKNALDAIGFGLGDRELKVGKSYQFAGSPELNHWNGITRIQFKLKDLRAT